MKKLLLVIALVIVGVLFAVLGSPFASNGTDGLPTNNHPPPVTDDTPITPGGEPPADRTWISPGKVTVTIGSGASYPVAAEYAITIHNGNMVSTPFTVYYSEPHKVSEGFSMPPAGAQDWVIIADTDPVLAPRETRDVMVTLIVPKKQQPNWEFWIVAGESGSGTVIAEMAVRWLVITRS